MLKEKPHLSGSEGTSQFRGLMLNYYLKNPIRNPHSLTLTMKQGYRVETPTGPTWVRLDGIKSVTNLRHFRHRINHKIYKNGYTRFNKQIGIFSIMEKDTDHRFHLHCIIEKPDWYSREQFHHLVWSCWNKTNFGYTQIDLNELPLYDEKKWLGYILKGRTKDPKDLWFSVDWENTTNFKPC